MQNILLVEDCKSTQVLVQSALNNKCRVTCASSVSEAFELLSNNLFSLVLLDVILPDGDGFQFCTELRRRNNYQNTPIIFLTGKSEVKDKVFGFSVGADDYIVKPFDALELAARVDCKLSRLREASSEQNFCNGKFNVDLAMQRILQKTIDGEMRDLNLTSIEFKILYYFLRHQGQVFHRDEILEAVWGKDITVGDSTVATHIYSLRKKMGDFAQCIEALPRRGYRFNYQSTNS